MFCSHAGPRAWGGASDRLWKGEGTEQNRKQRMLNQALGHRTSTTLENP